MADLGEEHLWRISRRDAAMLDALHDELWEWRRMASGGGDLVAIGAVIEALEDIQEGEDPRAAVQLECIVRPEMLDGLSCDFSISDEGIVLSQMQYIATGQGLSCDHGTTSRCVLSPDGDFSESGIDDWIRAARELRAQDADLRSTINGMEER